MDDDAHPAVGGTPARETALACLESALEAAHPSRVVEASVRRQDATLTVDGTEYDLSGYDEVVVVGGGKAAAGVADALETVLGDYLAGGVVVTPDSGEDGSDHRIDRRFGDHPTPSERGRAGADRVLAAARAAEEGTLLLVVVTGGASALLPVPAAGLDLPDLVAATDALVASGADIHEVNAVRKHLSGLKGGRLAAAAGSATVVGLLFSDVVGDDPSVIGSGPVSPDDSTYADALAVLDRYDVAVPGRVRNHLEAGAAGDREETPGPGHPAFDRASTHLLATASTALSAARETARDRGYQTCLLSSRVRGEAREAALTHAAITEEVVATGGPVAPPAVVLSGGEATVTVTGDGRGGPNAEFALAAAAGFRFETDPGDRVALLAADSDGRDGGTDAAGALVDPGTVPDAPARAAARDALADNDAHGYLADRGSLVYTGPTGTNVNDLRVVVVEASEDDPVAARG
jgi:hydroxypyruvate reductase